jgi:uncharacterized protein YbaR (Trm112 family)
MTVLSGSSSTIRAICFKKDLFCGMMRRCQNPRPRYPMLPHDLLDILVCPVCKGPLEARDNGQSLFCRGCEREYPVREGIPVLLPDEPSP